MVAIELKPDHFKTDHFFEKALDNSMRGIIEDKTGAIWFSTVKGIGRMGHDGQISIINTQRFSYAEDYSIFGLSAHGRKRRKILGLDHSWVQIAKRNSKESAGQRDGD